MRNEPVPALAARLFDEIAALSPDIRGVSRPAYSAVETAVLAHLAAAARAEGLEVWQDAALNLYAGLPGTREAAGVVLVGSHADSVPQGGNFDGLAGVIAGLCVLVRAMREGVTPPRPIHLIALRGEESPWFGLPYLGSRIVTGQMTAEDLDRPHRDDGRPLSAHLEGLGIPVAEIRAGRPMIDLSRIAGYVELHIEQGPVLIDLDAPVATVSGIRGNLRHNRILCEGVAGHSGAVPQDMRHDAVLAVAELLALMEGHALDWAGEGADLVFTCGMIGTDPARHALTRIPDEVAFSTDMRSLDESVLARFHALMEAEMAAIAARRGVRFVPDAIQRARPATCDAELVEAMKLAMLRRRIRPVTMASGAGHDAAMFAQAGVPVVMMFVRNANGSHNPDEAMAMGDFEIACETLYDLLCRDPMENAMDAAPPPAFADLAQTVRQHGGGTYAFEAAARAAREWAIDHPGHALALNLAAMAATQVARRFDDQAVTASQAAERLAEFERRLAWLDSAAAESDAGRRLQMLNDLAAQLLDVERNEG